MRSLLVRCFVFSVLLLVTRSEEEASELHAADSQEEASELDANSQGGSNELEDANELDAAQDPVEGELDDATDADEEAEEGSEEDSVWTDEQLSSEQSRSLHKKMDSDNDGKISLVEVLDFSKVSKKSMAAKEMTELLVNMDSDKDGKISLDELLENEFGYDPPVEAEVTKQTPEQEAEDADIKQRKELEKDKFKIADANGDGFLDEKELPAAFHPELHDGVITLTAGVSLKQKDTDGDGELSEAEFWGDEKAANEEGAQVMKDDFEKLDTDKSGKLNLEEFKKWESGSFHTADAMSDLFQIADEDMDGHISASELDNARPMLANSVAASHFMEWVDHYEL